MTAHEPGRIYDAFIGFNDTSRQKERLAAHAQEHGITPSQALRDALWHFLGPDMERGEEWPSTPAKASATKPAKKVVRKPRKALKKPPRRA